MNKQFIRMKNLLLSIVIVGLFLACQPNTENKNTEESDSVANTENQELDAAKTLTLPYVAVIDSTSTYIEIEENPQRSKIPLSQEELAEALNIKYPDIKLSVGKVSHDTLYVNIPNATFLTQQSGTTGATTYLAEATYAFTEIPAINVVNFSFKEGDHAVPGPYTRGSFNKKNI